MNELDAQTMLPVPNVNVDIGKLIFDLAVPNIIMWLLVVFIVLLFFYARLPKIFKPKS